jgi:hypothetical protein
MAGVLALQQRGQGHVEAFRGLPTGAVQFGEALSLVRSAADPWPFFSRVFVPFEASFDPHACCCGADVA